MCTHTHTHTHAHTHKHAHTHTQALARMFQPLASWAQKCYQASLAEHLKDYGLRYDDLYDPLMDMVRRRPGGARARGCADGMAW